MSTYVCAAVFDKAGCFGYAVLAAAPQVLGARHLSTRLPRLPPVGWLKCALHVVDCSVPELLVQHRGTLSVSMLGGMLPCTCYGHCGCSALQNKGRGSSVQSVKGLSSTCDGLLTTVVAIVTLQFKDKADVLALMRRHPSWSATRSGAPAAAAAGHAAADVGAASVQPRQGSADAEQGASGSEDDSLGSIARPDDAQDDMQDEFVSDTALAAAAAAEPAASPVAPPAAAAPAAAASPAGARTKLRSNFTEEELAVMRELNLRHLSNVKWCTTRSGESRWGVALSAEGLPARQGK